MNNPRHTLGMRQFQRNLNACAGEKSTSTTSRATRDSRSQRQATSTPAGHLQTAASEASRSIPDLSVSTTAKTVKTLRKPAKSSTPTQKTLYRLKMENYTIAIVERWNPHARIRQDLFGFIDILALRNQTTLAIQTCSRSDIASHRTKILEHPNLPPVLGAGWVMQIWGWKDHTVRIETLT